MTEHWNRIRASKDMYTWRPDELERWFFREVRKEYFFTNKWN